MGSVCGTKCFEGESENVDVTDKSRSTSFHESLRASSIVQADLQISDFSIKGVLKEKESNCPEERKLGSPGMKDIASSASLKVLQNKLVGKTQKKVFIAKNKHTGVEHCMKIIKIKEKEDIDFQKSHDKHLYVLNHPRIVNLNHILYSESKNFGRKYLIFDHLPFGKLSDHLIPSMRLEEERVKYYVREILEGLFHMHDCGIFYKGVEGFTKDDVYITDSGHIKLSNPLIICEGDKKERNTSIDSQLSEDDCDKTPAEMAQDNFFSLAKMILLMVNIDPRLVDSLKTINPQSTSGEQQNVNLPEILSDDLQNFILLCLGLDKENPKPTLMEIMSHAFLKTSLTE